MCLLNTSSIIYNLHIRNDKSRVRFVGSGMIISQLATDAMQNAIGVSIYQFVDFHLALSSSYQFAILQLPRGKNPDTSQHSKQIFTKRDNSVSMRHSKPRPRQFVVNGCNCQISQTNITLHKYLH